jgi:hypothetical protein
VLLFKILVAIVVVARFTGMMIGPPSLDRARQALNLVIAFVLTQRHMYRGEVGLVRERPMR